MISDDCPDCPVCPTSYASRARAPVRASRARAQATLFGAGHLGHSGRPHDFIEENAEIGGAPPPGQAGHPLQMGSAVAEPYACEIPATLKPEFEREFRSDVAWRRAERLRRADLAERLEADTLGTAPLSTEQFEAIERELGIEVVHPRQATPSAPENF